MGKLLDYIARETQGECFASFKYCYDNMLPFLDGSRRVYYSLSFHY